MASHTTDGITYSYDETSGVLEKVEPSSGITSVIVPSSLDGITIRVIKAFSFYRCAGIEAVTLPSSIMKIESKAFFSCRELSSLTIGDGQHMISLEEVEPYAFAYANALETISVSPTNSMFSASNGMLIKTVGGDCHLVLGRNGAITIPQSISHIDAGAFSRVALVLDRDNNEIASIEAHASSVFRPVITAMQNNLWTENHYIDAFGTDQKIDALLVVVPTEHQGALETIMLDSISEDPYDAKIVAKAKSFVKDMRGIASRYIKNDRAELKAHLGVTWAVQYPEKVFRLINEQIISVRWENSEVLHKCFEQLISI